MAVDNRTVLLIGALDTKGEEYKFIYDLLADLGYRILVIDIGVAGEARCLRPDIGADRVAAAGGESLQELRRRGDRGHAMAVMSAGIARTVGELYESGGFNAVLGMGGTGGTSVISAAMRSLPVGLPKVLVSTVASGDTSPFLGSRDIVLVPSVVDVAGVNRISRKIYTEAVGALDGMIGISRSAAAVVQEDKPIIAVSMFGNTTVCVNRCRELLQAKGYEVLVFHCTGVGGKTMENLVEDGMVSAVLDITTTEWADELCAGVFSAGPRRLEAPGKRGIPHLIVPGCVDMVNFGPIDTVPSRYRDRLLYEWNPSVTLMRTTPDENKEMGTIFAAKANQANGPVAFLHPLQGVSLLDRAGHEFWWPEADEAFLLSLKSHLIPGIPVEEMDANINDPAFADRAVELLLGMIIEANPNNVHP